MLHSSVTANRRVALIGATGVVGRKVLDLLIQRFQKTVDVALFASRAQSLTVSGQTYSVHPLDSIDFSHYSLCLFATEQDVSEQWIERALHAGARVVDSSSWRRLDPDVPLVVPHVNEHTLRSHHRLCAHSNCIVSPLAQVLAPLQNAYGVKQIHVATYQSVSGAGKKGVEACIAETEFTLVDRDREQKATYFPRSIAFNVIPQVGEITAEGWCREEEKIQSELQKILNLRCSVWSSVVRVPVLQGHASAIWVEFETPYALHEIKSLWEKSARVTFTETYATPVEVQGKETVYVGRARQLTPFHLAAWVCSDNLLCGAALDMVDIAEHMLQFPQ